MSKSLRLGFSLAMVLSASVVVADELAQEVVASPAVVAVQRQELEPFTGRVTAAKVRVRVQPDLSGRIHTELAKDKLVVVDGKEGDFYSVKPEKGAKGYVYRTYILDNVVEASHVNVRLEPDLDSPVLAQLNAGDKVNGAPCAKNPKWLEIELPASVHFFVAQEFIERCGPADFAQTLENRTHEVAHLLSAAYAAANAELRKAFDEIDMDRVSASFKRIATEYSDCKEYAEKSGQLLAAVQELYTQKRLACIEARNAYNETATIQTSSELAACQHRLLELKRELVGESMIALDDSDKPLVLHLDKAIEELSRACAIDVAPAKTEKCGLSLSVTDKMLAWIPLEESLYQVWAIEHNDEPMDSFYQSQEEQVVFLQGTVEPYTRGVLSSPGDYVIKSGGRVEGFLYSTKVNLDKQVGRHVTLKAVARPNNHFAYPAYFVMAVECP